jgi:hypothetical protein
MVDRWALESPRPDGQSTLTFPFLYRNFPYRDFTTRDIKNHSIYRLPNPDAPKLRCARGLTFQRSRHLYRDFGLRGIMNPDVNGFGTLLSPNSDTVCHLSSTNFDSAVAHTLSFDCRDIAYRDIVIPVAIIWSFDSRNPDTRYTCRSNGPCGSDQWLCPPELRTSSTLAL